MRVAVAILCAAIVSCAEPGTAPTAPSPVPETTRRSAHVVVHVNGHAETSANTQHAVHVVALFESARDRQRRLVSASDWDAARQSATFALEVTFDETRTLDTRAQAGVTADALLVTFGDPRREHQVLARVGGTYLSAFSRVDTKLWDDLQAAAGENLQR